MSSTRKDNRGFAKGFFDDVEEELGYGHAQNIRPQYDKQALHETPDEDEDYGDEDFEVDNIELLYPFDV